MFSNKHNSKSFSQIGSGEINLINTFAYFKNLTGTFSRWFDTHAELEFESDKQTKSIDWIRCTPFIFLHLGCFGVIYVGWSWFSDIFLPSQ